MEQIERQVMEDVASGSIRPGERLPTPGELGAELGVSPGAVDKAYRRLAKAGVIESRPGVGPFIAETAISSQHALYTVAGSAIASALNRARRLDAPAGYDSWRGIVPFITGERRSDHNGKVRARIRS